MSKQTSKAFIFAGANASGKSTFICHLLENNIIDGQYICPDSILKDDLKLSESDANYFRAFKEADKRRKIAIQNSKDIILETVFASKNSIKLLDELKKNNYHITLFFTGTDDSKINAMYLTDRVKEGGHDVPIKLLIERRKNGMKNIKKAIDYIDCLVFVDNSIFSKFPQVMKSVYKNQICYVNKNTQRMAIWLNDITSELKTLDSAYIEQYVPEEHIRLCEQIINSLTSYDVLHKSYQEKNEILHQYSNSDNTQKIEIEK